MSLSLTTKYGFRIRTRQGLLINNLVIQGRDEADAEKKLRQMYRQCEILECGVVPARKTYTGNFAQTAPAAK